MSETKDEQATSDFPMEPTEVLELTEMELPDGSWCVVSADPAKPLTQEQAMRVSLKYTAMAQILAEGD